MPDKIPCPACGTDNPLSALQCQVCDYDLVKAAPAATSASRPISKCGRCGSQVAGGAAFCPVCGQSINERHPRPPTGALNVRKLFGELGDAPQPRGHIRERTEMAPSAAAYGNPMAVAQHGAPSPQQPASRESSDANSRRRRPAPRPQPQYSGFDAGDSGRDLARPSPSPAASPSPAPAANKYADAAPFMKPQPASAGPVTMYAGPFGPPPSSDPALDPSASTSTGNAPQPRARARAHAEPAARRGGTPPGDARTEARSPQAPAWGAPQIPTHAPSRTRLVLVGRDGQEGEVFSVPAHGIEIGRQAELRFPADPFVSPRHCRVTLFEGGVGLQDLDSRNGVYVRLREGVAVYPGDFFLLGNQLLRLDRTDPQQERPGDHDVRGFGTPAKPAWAMLTRVCTGEIDDDRYHLRGHEMIIGREDGDIVFPQDGFLSRQHARVRMDVQDNSMTVVLEDLDSANGTYLRIRRSAAVVPGGMFRVGDQIFRVRSD